MTSVLIPPACLADPFAGPPTSWPLRGWDFYVERAGIREAAGESPAQASANAERDVREWVRLKGDEWIKNRQETTR